MESSALAEALPASSQPIESEFAKSLRPVGRILGEEGYFVWCCSPIYGPDGKVHVFYSRWPVKAGFHAWLTGCEVAHAVADRPEGPYTMTDIALTGRGGDHWDGGTIHNPSVHRVGDKYVLFYLGTRRFPDGPDKYERALRTKRVGMAVADSLDGPWTRVSDATPLLEAGPAGAWDDIGTTNPAFLQHPDGRFWLYYKSWNVQDHLAGRGVRKYGLAIADRLEGPYVKQSANPVIDLTKFGKGIQCEDAFIWRDVDDNRYKMVMRDMSFYGERYGLLFDSEDGINWSRPLVGYGPSSAFFPDTPSITGRGGRFERPQLLMGPDGRPTHLFCAFGGGDHETSTGAVLKIVP